VEEEENQDNTVAFDSEGKGGGNGDVNVEVRCWPPKVRITRFLLWTLSAIPPFHIRRLVSRHGTVCRVDLLYSSRIYTLNLISTHLSCHPHFVSDLR